MASDLASGYAALCSSSVKITTCRQWYAHGDLKCESTVKCLRTRACVVLLQMMYLNPCHLTWVHQFCQSHQTDALSASKPVHESILWGQRAWWELCRLPMSELRIAAAIKSFCHTNLDCNCNGCSLYRKDGLSVAMADANNSRHSQMTWDVMHTAPEEHCRTHTVICEHFLPAMACTLHALQRNCGSVSHSATKKAVTTELQR